MHLLQQVRYNAPNLHIKIQPCKIPEPPGVSTPGVRGCLINAPNAHFFCVLLSTFFSGFGGSGLIIVTVMSTRPTGLSRLSLF